MVADEVRNLATGAAEAAEDTKRLIEGTVEKITEGEEQVTRSLSHVIELYKSLRRRRINQK